MVEDILSED